MNNDSTFTKPTMVAVRGPMIDPLVSNASRSANLHVVMSTIRSEGVCSCVLLHTYDYRHDYFKTGAACYSSTLR